MDNEYDNQDESGGAGSWLERMTGRSMGDIRIHDSAQAGELARRLGARAFTVGRDIYVRSELVNTGTPEGKALIAHEATHALEQSGASTSDMPLLRPQARGGSGIGGAVSVQRAAATGGANPASLPASEVHAEAVESSAAQSAQGSQGGQAAQGKSEQQNTQASQQPNAEEVAERVYELMLREMTIDIERGAYL